MSAAPGATGVVRVGDEQIDALTTFFRRTWNPGATVEQVRNERAAQARANPHGTGTDAPTFLFVRQGEAIGHVGTIPVRLQVHGRVVHAHWLKGLMVLPEHQGGPVGFLLVKDAARALGWAMALVVKPEARRLFTALGFAEPGALVDHVRVLDAPAIMRMDASRLGGSGGRVAAMLRLVQRLHLAGIAGAGLGTALRLWSAIGGRGRGTTVASPLAEMSADSLDRLWERARASLEVAIVRDAAYLVDRYPSGEYVGVLVRDAAGPSALTVLRRPGPSTDPRLAGVRVATLSDILAVDEMAAFAAIDAAEREARRLGAQALICGASHPRLRRWLRRRGFVPVGARVHLLARGANGEAVPPFDAWWLTRGDSNADEVF